MNHNHYDSTLKSSLDKVIPSCISVSGPEKHSGGADQKQCQCNLHITWSGEILLKL